ncbi:MAG TPA: CarD family transcriptional regulator [Acetobacteraceae bacterium]|nr:CarD family transcriptional regulator [Acetobacteraceae bacterium]
MVDEAFGATAAAAEPGDEDPFQAGDFVVYPGHGVGTIDCVGSEEFAGHRLNLVRISFAENHMTLRIPLAGARAAGLRKIASGDVLAEVMATLGGRPRTSRLVWTKRALAYLAKINSGDIRALAEAVRDLQSAADGSRASFGQRNLFELAIDRLAGEVAAATGAEKGATIERLRGMLHEARQVECLPARRVAEYVDA